MIIAITGATGFIGRNLCDHFRRLGWEVRALVRDVSSYPYAEQGIRSFPCDLPDSLDRKALDAAGVLIHCAYVTRHADLEAARLVNETGTRRVIDACREAGVGRIVFVSSQSAHDGALSYYGRSKRDLEALLSERDLILRPGLVLGPGEAGLFGRMCETVRASRLIPLFGGGRQPLQTVHIDDLCVAVERALERDVSGPLVVAEPRPVEMRSFLRLLARKLGRNPLLVPCPLAPALLALRLLEALRIPFPVSSENLLGLKQMRADDTSAVARDLDLRVRSAGESLDAIFAGPRPRL